METWQPPGQTPHQGVGPLPRHRDLVVAILLSVFTFGIYNLYWLYTTWKETAQHMGKAHRAQTALILAIIGYAITFGAVIAAIIFNVVAVFGSDGDPGLGALGAYFIAMAISFVFGLATQGILAWMMWGAAGNAEKILQARGMPPAIPAIVHVIIPFIFGLWTTVAIALVQNDLNKLHQR